jgi:hypothetical protein
MTQALTIDYGSSNLNLNSGNYTLIDGFFPEAPDMNDKTTTDIFYIYVIGTSSADLNAKITAVKQLFEYARTHQRGSVAAWLNWAVNGSQSAWRTRIMDGQVMYDERLAVRWRENKAKIQIVIAHLPWWEGPEVQIPLTNANGTDSVNGLTVDNSYNGTTMDNTVLIDGDNVAGELPAATRLEIINTYASANLLFDLWIGQNFTDPSNVYLTHWNEAESATGGTEMVSAAASGGYFKRCTLPQNIETELLTFALSGNLMSACHGRDFKFFVNFFLASPTNAQFKLRIKYQNVTIWETGRVWLDSTRATIWRDLFTIQLPPWLRNQSALRALDLVLCGYQNIWSTMTVDMDVIQLLPADGWRHIQPVGYGVAQNERVIDDGINGAIYIDNGAGADKIGILIGHHQPIMLEPGKDQKLYFVMHSNQLDTAELDRSISLKLYYRPRAPIP